jgi:hypothetical protein
MPVIASVRTKYLAAMLVMGAVALISPGMAFAHAGGGSFGGGGSPSVSSGGGHSGGGGSSSSSGHATVSSSAHRSAAVSQGRTGAASSAKNISRNHKRWFLFRRSRVMHTDCLSQPKGSKLVLDAGCDVRKSSKP